MDSYSNSSRDSSSPFDSIVFDFLVEKCGFPESKASALRVELFKTYGSSLAGLRALGYDIDADDYHSYVHGRLPYELIKPDAQLRSILRSINQRKIIFTNSDRIHAIKALDRLGIKDCFEQIICFETMNCNLSKATRPNEIPVILKPSMEAMNIAIEAAQVEPCRTVGRTTKTKEADYALETVTDLFQVVPAIWFKEEEDQKMRRTGSELDSLLATTAVGA